MLCCPISICFLYSITKFVAVTRGSASMREDDIVSVWRESSDDLKDCLGSVVIPIGSLSVGICRHRALLFKVRS